MPEPGSRPKSRSWRPELDPSLLSATVGDPAPHPAEPQRGDRAWATARTTTLTPPNQHVAPSRPQSLNKGSLTPSPADSLRRLSSLALVRPWCSLSGLVGSLPAGASPLGGGRGVDRCDVGALRAHDAAVAPTGRCSRCETGALTGRVPRYASSQPSQRCPRDVHGSSAVRCAQRCSCMVSPRTSWILGTRVQYCGRRRWPGPASARTSYFAMLRVSWSSRCRCVPAHFTKCRSSRRVPWIGDPRMHSRSGRIPAARRMRYAPDTLRVTLSVARTRAHRRERFPRGAVRCASRRVLLRAAHAFRPRSVFGRSPWRSTKYEQTDAVRDATRSASCRTPSDAQREAQAVPAGSDDLTRNAESTIPIGEAGGTQGSIHGRGHTTGRTTIPAAKPHRGHSAFRAGTRPGRRE
ncbi:hypothetical protein JOF43_002780 [Brachybacterium sacelli]|uniref:Uncharacterized protein n=1 Tax=Brachybacterium sacelli TaxID=173364 RepID=A0ABS4X3P1_9MICO|nr:hypothetical protein [Brachybacterium sacelli]